MPALGETSQLIKVFLSLQISFTEEKYRSLVELYKTLVNREEIVKNVKLE